MGRPHEFRHGKGVEYRVAYHFKMQSFGNDGVEGWFTLKYYRQVYLPWVLLVFADMFRKVS